MAPFPWQRWLLFSSRRPDSVRLAEEGDAGAQIALELANNPNQLLSAVQTGMTLMATLAGAFGGATIANELAIYLKEVPALGSLQRRLALACVVLLITFFNLVIGELVPKRIALSNPERIAALSASPCALFQGLFIL